MALNNEQQQILEEMVIRYYGTDEPDKVTALVELSEGDLKKAVEEWAANEELAMEEQLINLETQKTKTQEKKNLYANNKGNITTNKTKI